MPMNMGMTAVLCYAAEACEVLGFLVPGACAAYRWSRKHPYRVGYCPRHARRQKAALSSEADPPRASGTGERHRPRMTGVPRSRWAQAAHRRLAAVGFGPADGTDDNDCDHHSVCDGGSCFASRSSLAAASPVSIAMTRSGMFRIAF
jgi:hypothetical protein